MPTFWVFLAVAAFVVVLLDSTEAAVEGRIYRVGVVTTGGLQSRSVRGIRDGLKEAGFKEGDNLVLGVGPTLGKGVDQGKVYDEFHGVARRYEDEKVDVIVAVGSTATRIAKEATSTIPIVFWERPGCRGR